MGLKIRKYTAGVMFLSMILGIPEMAYGAEQASIEQVYANLPEVEIYGNGIPTSGLNVYLGSQELQLEQSGAFEETGEPIYYYVLLDISNSIPDSYFVNIKQAIGDFEDTLRAEDRMIVYTFGEQVHMVLDEEHSRENTRTILESLENKDNRTFLFDAVNQAADYAAQVLPDECQRRILMVISDGEDFTIGGSGAQETQKNLSEKGLPVYAFAIADTARDNINSFGEFARTTGGQISVFHADELSVLLNDFHQQRMSDQYFDLKAENNLVSNQMETLTLKMEDNQNVVKDVMVNRYIPDTEAPVIKYAELLDDGKLRIGFSETVQGEDSAANYIITCGEKQETVTSVNTDNNDSNALILTFAEKLSPGTYALSCINITDVSMEKNKVSNVAEFEVAQLSLKSRVLNAVKHWYGAVLLGTVLILIAVILTVYRRVKRGHGVIYVDGKPVIASGVEVHQHVEIQDEEGKEFQVIVRVKSGKPETLKLKMKNSFIVGRTKLCNLYFDDKRMSRQHFALEWDGKNMYVTDLNTTNGTLLNDVRISKRRRLNQGDKITAGSVDMIIRW